MEYYSWPEKPTRITPHQPLFMECEARQKRITDLRRILPKQKQVSKQAGKERKKKRKKKQRNDLPTSSRSLTGLAIMQKTPINQSIIRKNRNCPRILSSPVLQIPFFSSFSLTFALHPFPFSSLCPPHLEKKWRIYPPATVPPDYRTPVRRTTLQGGKTDSQCCRGFLL